MTSQLEESFEVLERMPAALDALLRGTTPSWHRGDEGPETWSAFEVVGHLVHGEETDWVPRARIILKHGEERPFEPFDRFAQLTRFRDWALGDLLDRFAELRRENVRTVRGWELTDEQLALWGRHPALGQVTLAQLLSTWAVHDLNHVVQIARVMARQHADRVGPWREFLSVLQR
ncbi:MAG: DinB family protein [Thermoanaerobaculia bacterium]